jgi:uncharacterized protein (DUF2141 family)
MNRIAASRFASLALTTGLLAAAFAATATAGDLTVKLNGVRAQTGLVKVALVNSAEAWDDKAPPVQADGAPPQGDTRTFVFKDLKPGSYAVMISHDENGNGKLDTNFIGMPVEGYGFSNNPKVMRKPTWEEARFEMTDASAGIDVELR